MHVIGTAGHVDHGKSTLVEALTGIDPDRLKEEKEREMTIDLGFAWMSTGEGQPEIGIVDVPGHRDFIENMLAGVGGIDLALFVVAADEGVMPQTREHLAILDLLEVRSGIVALTKIDTIEDPEWVELVILDVEEALANTSLSKAPILPVSARTGEGIEELRNQLVTSLAQTEPRPDLSRPRLPIDRVFSITGFGTIVTGTLLDGRFRVGEAIEIQPAGLAGRIRGLQTHKTKLEEAKPGSRVAVNLAGIGKAEVSRGDVAAAPGVISSTGLCDVAYRHLPDVDIALKHNTSVKLFIGSSEVMARTRVLGARQISPGEEGWLQLELSEPVAMARGDRFILRRPSPGSTLGGGRVLDPKPGRKHRRFRAEIVPHLETLAHGNPVELLLQAVSRSEPTDWRTALSIAGLGAETAQEAREELLRQATVLEIGDFVFTRSGWNRVVDSALGHLAAFHREHPLRLGMPREELRSRLRLSPAVYNVTIDILVKERLVTRKSALVGLPGHEIRFTEEKEELVRQTLLRFENMGVNSPSVKEAKERLGEDVYHALLDLGRLRQISDEVVYSTEVYAKILDRVTEVLRDQGRVSAAELRDVLGTSRKYAIAILEHLDQQRITRRLGDSRELIKPASPRGVP